MTSLTTKYTELYIGNSSDIEEKKLQEEIKEKLILKGWELIGREYLVIDNYSQFGVGDLIFKKDNKIGVVECKYINLNESGKNQSTKRTKARKKVKEQTIYYSTCAKLKHRDCIVIGATYTNESDLKIICKFKSLEKAKNIFMSILREKHYKKSSFNQEIYKTLKKLITLE